MITMTLDDYLELLFPHRMSQPFAVVKPEQAEQIKQCPDYQSKCVVENGMVCGRHTSLPDLVTMNLFRVWPKNEYLLYTNGFEIRKPEVVSNTPARAHLPASSIYF